MPHAAARRCRPPSRRMASSSARLRDHVATVGWLEAERAIGIAHGLREHEEAIGDVEHAGRGACLAQRAVTLREAGRGRRMRLLELVRAAVPGVGNRDERLRGRGRIDGERAVVIPQLERAGLAHALDAPPGPAGEHLDVAMEGDQALAVARVQRLPAADPPRDPDGRVGRSRASSSSRPTLTSGGPASRRAIDGLAPLDRRTINETTTSATPMTASAAKMSVSGMAAEGYRSPISRGRPRPAPPPARGSRGRGRPG